MIYSMNQANDLFKNINYSLDQFEKLINEKIDKSFKMHFNHAITPEIKKICGTDLFSQIKALKDFYSDNSNLTDEDTEAFTDQINDLHHQLRMYTIDDDLKKIQKEKETYYKNLFINFDGLYDLIFDAKLIAELKSMGDSNIVPDAIPVLETLWKNLAILYFLLPEIYGIETPEEITVDKTIDQTGKISFQSLQNGLLKSIYDENEDFLSRSTFLQINGKKITLFFKEMLSHLHQHLLDIVDTNKLFNKEILLGINRKIVEKLKNTYRSIKDNNVLQNLSNKTTDHVFLDLLDSVMNPNDDHTTENILSHLSTTSLYAYLILKVTTYFKNFDDINQAQTKKNKAEEIWNTIFDNKTKKIFFRSLSGEKFTGTDPVEEAVQIFNDRQTDLLPIIQSTFSSLPLKINCKDESLKGFLYFYIHHKADFRKSFVHTFDRIDYTQTIYEFYIDNAIEMNQKQKEAFFQLLTPCSPAAKGNLTVAHLYKLDKHTTPLNQQHNENKIQANRMLFELEAKKIIEKSSHYIENTVVQSNENFFHYLTKVFSHAFKTYDAFNLFLKILGIIAPADYTLFDYNQCKSTINQKLRVLFNYIDLQKNKKDLIAYNSLDPLKEILQADLAKTLPKITEHFVNEMNGKLLRDSIYEIFKEEIKPSLKKVLPHSMFTKEISYVDTVSILTKMVLTKFLKIEYKPSIEITLEEYQKHIDLDHLPSLNLENILNQFLINVGQPQLKIKYKNFKQFQNDLYLILATLYELIDFEAIKDPELLSIVEEWYKNILWNKMIKAGIIKKAKAIPSFLIKFKNKAQNSFKESFEKLLSKTKQFDAQTRLKTVIDSIQFKYTLKDFNELLNTYELEVSKKSYKHPIEQATIQTDLTAYKQMNLNNSREDRESKNRETHRKIKKQIEQRKKQKRILQEIEALKKDLKTSIAIAKAFFKISHECMDLKSHNKVLNNTFKLEIDDDRTIDEMKMDSQNIAEFKTKLDNTEVKKFYEELNLITKDRERDGIMNPNKIQRLHKKVLKRLLEQRTQLEEKLLSIQNIQKNLFKNNSSTNEGFENDPTTDVIIASKTYKAILVCTIYGNEDILEKVSFIDRIYKATTFIPDFSTDDAKAETLNEALTMTILNMIISDEITVEKKLSILNECRSILEKETVKDKDKLQNKTLLGTVGWLLYDEFYSITDTSTTSKDKSQKLRSLLTHAEDEREALQYFLTNFKALNFDNADTFIATITTELKKLDGPTANIKKFEQALKTQSQKKDSKSWNPFTWWRYQKPEKQPEIQEQTESDNSSDQKPTTRSEE
ncbi:hypothetical protein IPH25_04740 [bacterium]|nr:MAG: hypothetical protein IPH25_04740 [bacterium]